jgi:hypothetical protein
MLLLLLLRHKAMPLTTPCARSSVVLSMPFMMRSTICSTQGFSQPGESQQQQQQDHGQSLLTSGLSTLSSTKGFSQPGSSSSSTQGLIWPARHQQMRKKQASSQTATAA